MLDEALLRIAQSKAHPATRRALSEHVSEALRAVYGAMRGGTREYRDAMTVASMKIDDAAQAAIVVPGDPDIAHAVERLCRAQELASRSPLPAREWRLPGSAATGARIPASVGALRVLDLEREVVAPVVPLAPSPVQPALTLESSSAVAPIASLDELDALMAHAEKLPIPASPKRVGPTPTATRVLGVVSATDALVRSARALAEELGVLGAQRRPAPGRAWGSQARYEARLLARVDALVSCGAHVLPVLVRGLEDRPVPDPELTWALVVLHGVIAGDDSLDEALRLVRAADLAHPGLRDAAEDALALLPTARVEGLLRPWLTHADAPMRRVAVAVLGRRGGLLAHEVLAAASDEDELVVRAAAAALGRIRGRVSPAALDALLHHPVEDVVRVSLAGAARSGHAEAVSRARDLVRAHRGDFADASLVYALCAGRAALEDLVEDSMLGRGPAGIRALGWFGHLDAVPELCARLESGEQEIRDAAAEALVRVTGLAEPRWPTWWTQVGQHLERTTRHRHGAPWSAATNLAELRAATSTLRERELCFLELRARVALRGELDLQGFAAPQLTSLSALEDELRTTELPQTGWPVTLRI